MKPKPDRLRHKRQWLLLIRGLKQWNQECRNTAAVTVFFFVNLLQQRQPSPVSGFIDCVRRSIVLHTCQDFCGGNRDVLQLRPTSSNHAVAGKTTLIHTSHRIRALWSKPAGTPSLTMTLSLNLIARRPIKKEDQVQQQLQFLVERGGGGGESDPSGFRSPTPSATSVCLLVLECEKLNKYIKLK